MEVKDIVRIPVSNGCAFIPFFFASPCFVSSLFMFCYPDEDVNSRSRRVCALLQHSTQSTDRVGKGVCG